MTISPAQKRAQGWLLAELKKELDDLDACEKKISGIGTKYDKHTQAVNWIRDWISDKEKEIA